MSEEKVRYVTHIDGHDVDAEIAKQFAATCKNCKHWAKYSQHFFGDCSASAGYGNFNQPNQFYVNGTFLTGPDFGCIHWRGK